MNIGIGFEILLGKATDPKPIGWELKDIVSRAATPVEGDDSVHPLLLVADAALELSNRVFPTDRIYRNVELQVGSWKIHLVRDWRFGGGGFDKGPVVTTIYLETGDVIRITVDEPHGTGKAEFASLDWLVWFLEHDDAVVEALSNLLKQRAGKFMNAVGAYRRRKLEGKKKRRPK